MATASVTNTLTNGTTIDAPDLNTNFSDLVSFINSNCLQKDGSLTATAALNLGGFGITNAGVIAMGTNKITGLAAPTADTDAATRKFADTFVVQFTQSGELAVGAGTVRWYPPFDCDVVAAYANVGTAPTGATIEVDVNRTGTTVFTTQTLRPIIAASAFYDASGTPDGTVAMTAGTDYLTVDVDQVGSTVAGSDLVVTVHLRRT